MVDGLFLILSRWGIMMKRNVLFLFILLFALPVFAEQWVTLFEAEDTKTLIDVDSITRQNGLVFGNLRQIDYKPVAKQSNAIFAFSCQRKAGALPEVATFFKTEQGFLPKEFIQNQNLSEDQFEQIMPGTYGEAVMSFACAWDAIRDQAIARLPIRKN